MRKTIFLLLSLSSIPALAFCYFFLNPFIPRMPAEWSRILPGMKRSDALVLLGEVHDMRELKGFDMVSWIPNTRCYWQLELCYKTNGHETISDVFVRYTDRNNGLFNRQTQLPDDDFVRKYTASRATPAFWITAGIAVLFLWIGWVLLRERPRKPQSTTP